MIGHAYWVTSMHLCKDYSDNLMPIRLRLSSLRGWSRYGDVGGIRQKRANFCNALRFIKERTQYQKCGPKMYIIQKESSQSGCILLGTGSNDKYC